MNKFSNSKIHKHILSHCQLKTIGTADLKRICYATWILKLTGLFEPPHARWCSWIHIEIQRSMGGSI